MPAPTLADVFEVMSAASLGDADARVSLPTEPDLSNMATRLAIALNLLLDDMAFRVRERERVEERLLQAQKLEAIGSLAGGVAHDFNNLLSVILGYTDLALDALPQGPLRSDLEEVKRAGESARDLTRQLLAFSRRQILAPRVIDLNATVSSMEKMLRHVLGTSVKLNVETPDRLGRIKADPGQIEQIIMNLVVNARDAMPGGGELTLRTASVAISGAHAMSHPELRPGPHVRLIVTDTGIGMDAEVRRRVFEPFFTTKEQGSGTGLGLATVFGIVQQSGGHITVTSELGRGTTFEVYFPALDAPGEATRLPPGEGLRN